MSEWFSAEAGNTRGPEHADELRRRLATGEIKPGTLVWCPEHQISPMPIGLSLLAADTAPKARWFYHRAGARVGPINDAEMGRLVGDGSVKGETLVWHAALGTAFVPLATTGLAPVMTEPPALPASAVDDTLAWILVALPLVAALIEAGTGWKGPMIAGWPIAPIAANWLISALDERRVRRSGVSDGSITLGRWIWLVPVYLYQRARALKGPKYYFLAWLASFAASLFVGPDNLMSVLNGDTYLGTGLPACDSRFEIRQVRKIFDSAEAVRVAGLTAQGLDNAREINFIDGTRTCAARIKASNGMSYGIAYTVEYKSNQILTTIEFQ